MAIRTLAVIMGAVVAPAAVLPPPLSTGTSPGNWAPAETRYLSQLGVAGKKIYDANCVQCHGYAANGSRHGPPLNVRAYWIDNMPNRYFHEAVNGGAHQRLWDYGDMPAVDGLSFNEVERVVRYVREMQRPVLFQAGG